jgi:hypothetical protein
MVDLNTLIPSNSNLQLVDAQAINDRGEIAGDGLPPGCTVDGQCGQSFVLIPCDEEHSDEEGCDDTAGAGAATSSSAPETQSSTRTKEASLTPREIMARMRARFGRNRRFGAWTQK